LSTVVAIKDNDKVWIGCDSQVSFGWTKLSTTENTNKVFRIGDSKNVVIGCVGALRDLNIISTAEQLIEEYILLKDSLDFKYIVRNVVPKIFKELDRFGRLETNNNIQSMYSTFLITYKDKMFKINSDGSVSEGKEILAIGSGYITVLGAYEAIKDNTTLTAQEKLIACLKASCEQDLHVNYPIIITNTLEEKDTIIYKDNKI